MITIDAIKNVEYYHHTLKMGEIVSCTKTQVVKDNIGYLSLSILCKL